MAIKMSQLPEFGKMVSNVLKTYYEATEDERSEGMSWYNRAYEICDEVATAYGVKTSQVVGVMAVVSPAMTWDQNEFAPAKICDLYSRGIRWEAWAGFATWGPNRKKAQRILDGDYDAISGNKVTAFYGAIMGATDSVALDRWAIRVLLDNPTLGNDMIVPSGKKCYDYMAEVYKKAAEVVGINPSDIQAVTWTVYRNRYNGKSKLSSRVNSETGVTYTA